MKIYESLSAIMQDMKPIGKDKKNTQQNFKYRGIDDVMNALQPLLSKYKVVVVPHVIEQIREERTSSKGNNLLYSIMKIKYIFYAEDGTFVEAVVVGEGMDSGDKASNKAMAVAFKYACFQVLCIPTEEMKDPDAECHEVKPRNVLTIGDDEVNSLMELAKKAGFSFTQVAKVCDKEFGVNTLSELTPKEYHTICERLKSKISEDDVPEFMKEGAENG